MGSALFPGHWSRISRPGSQSTTRATAPAASVRRPPGPGSLCRFVVAATVLVGSAKILAARAVRIWSYQDLLAKSDLVAIVVPTATQDTDERIELPGFPGEHIVGVETKCAASAVLKGNSAVKAFAFHHYRTADGTNVPHVPNGPSFVSLAAGKAYILFLRREGDGRYAPVVGQADPGLAVRQLVAVQR